MTEDALRDPMQELVDKYANAAESHKKEEMGNKLMDDLIKQNTTNLDQQKKNQTIESTQNKTKSEEKKVKAPQKEEKV